MKIITHCNTLLCSNLYYKYYCNKFSTQLSDFPKTFNRKKIEHEWYHIWEKNDYFAPKNNKKIALKMLLPPPNITGTLHLGHALTVTIQDILARWYRMKGHSVVWIPGFDHAGIATQTMVEKYLFKTKGINKSDIGKDEFLSYIWQWKNEKENIIKSQLKALGASLDWSKEYFTMSKKHNNAVIEAIITLNNRNLLYRKKDLINWSPSLSSTISDIEIEHLYVTKKTQLQVPGYEKMITFGEIVHIAYPVKDSKHEIIVATTRPETLFGDVAIAVHPDDERYAKYIGQQVWHTLRQTYIPIISDYLVDKQFGTGAIKVTPAHDPLDYMIAKNHQLEIIEVIDKYGNITKAGKQFEGLPRFIVREKILNELSNKGILKSISDHNMCIPLCSRTHDVIEYLLKEQWFIKCKNMAQKAIEAVKQGQLKIIPNTQEIFWYDYLNNIRDWCISRQVWWGHSIPAYYITIEGKTEWIIARTENDAKIIVQNKYGSDIKLYKDEDVLDTWFSSAILPFAIMGWPEKTEDLKKYYPLTLMETGRDILFFWVARMVMLGLELTNCLPFDEVLLHGLLCDAYGKKMSKTLGNIVSPENIINGISLNDLTAQMKKSYNIGILNEAILKRMLNANNKLFPNGIPECGADALRMTLSSHNIKNQHINFDIMECQTNKYFLNKIWQASKYILLMTNEKIYQKPINITIIDQWILSRLSLMINTINNAFIKRDFHKVIASMKQFLYYEFCDFYLEGSKWGFKSENINTHISHTYVLRKCLEVFLRASAPIIPYLCDDLYKRLSNIFPEFLSITSLMEAHYPIPEEFNKWRNVPLDEKINEILKIILEIRSIMGNINKKLNPEIHIIISKSEDFNFYNDVISLIKGGCKIFNIFIFLQKNYIEHKNSICHSYSPTCTISIVLEDLSILKELEKKILNKRITQNN
ncbi:valine--tRNA ligase isoform X1 [Apis mellifera]|uniref:valine--tRNA ligase n=1 Tax=Apis mellifera TaxID=7460 RepID=A0A7M7SQT5_APIME|nr:valine--tRNA ligase isoform X1 [Apis mellifera]|eukprot:XP_026299461.1 valine--tRNA ligase isoform X1 [Apis mellifera]